MLNMKNLYKSIVLQCAYLFIVFTLTASMVNCMESGLCIEPYQQERDYESVMSIVHENYNYLAYESLGCAQGTTEKYFKSPKYITKVLRDGDETVGFINYIAHNVEFLTFHIRRQGLIHLIGVKKEHQCKGYGSALLEYAVSNLKELKVPKIGLSVDKNNKRAQDFYQKRGFMPLLLDKRIPAAIMDKIPLIYELRVDISANELPQGNIIQRYPKTSFTLAAITVAGVISARSLMSSAHRINV